MAANIPRDEPTKLREIVVPALGPVENQRVELHDGAQARLILGALDQDDCAAYMMTGEQILVAGSDYVRGSKFRLYESGLLGNYEIGWYLAGANLSDIAAMGAVPLALLSVIRYPKDFQDSEFQAILEGIRDACQSVGARNVGGDIGSAERIILSASAFGIVEPAGLLTRAAARVGQIVCLTGPTGLAGSAMRLGSSQTVVSRMSPTAHATLLDKWRRVSPRVAHGRFFAGNAGATACLDTSDGLKGALETLSACSGVRVSVDENAVPIHPAVRAAASILDVDPLELVFGDSVDFELVVTVDEVRLAELQDTCTAAGLELFPIGTVEVGAGAWLVTHDVAGPLPGVAWRHS